MHFISSLTTAGTLCPFKRLAYQSTCPYIYRSVCNVFHEVEEALYLLIIQNL